ncbi:protein kinase [Nocardia sp. NPDC050710]|uniref:protein kinase domain-containing protein n=1 Tax=Nocardia sp. NPDC050710 TaxID=3157220 RepID=UPI0033C5DCE2
MQYIDGIDASSADPATVPSARAIQIIGETAKALYFAHSMGVLHRDVKPANILLARAAAGQERVYLTDFGIARLRGDAGHLTRTRAFTVTLAYASPEQLTGGRPIRSVLPRVHPVLAPLRRPPLRLDAPRRGHPGTPSAVPARGEQRPPRTALRIRCRPGACHGEATRRTVRVVREVRRSGPTGARGYRTGRASDAGSRSDARALLPVSGPRDAADRIRSRPGRRAAADAPGGLAAATALQSRSARGSLGGSGPGAGGSRRRCGRGTGVVGQPIGWGSDQAGVPEDGVGVAVRRRLPQLEVQPMRHQQVRRRKQPGDPPSEFRELGPAMGLLQRRRNRREQHQPNHFRDLPVCLGE